jgi:hypothetical protein
MPNHPGNSINIETLVQAASRFSLVDMGSDQHIYCTPKLYVSEGLVTLKTRYYAVVNGIKPGLYTDW